MANTTEIPQHLQVKAAAAGLDLAWLQALWAKVGPTLGPMILQILVSLLAPTPPRMMKIVSPGCPCDHKAAAEAVLAAALQTACLAAQHCVDCEETPP